MKDIENKNTNPFLKDVYDVWGKNTNIRKDV